MTLLILQTEGHGWLTFPVSVSLAVSVTGVTPDPEVPRNAFVMCRSFPASVGLLPLQYARGADGGSRGEGCRTCVEGTEPLWCPSAAGLAGFLPCSCVSGSSGAASLRVRTKSFQGKARHQSAELVKIHPSSFQELLRWGWGEKERKGDLGCVCVEGPECLQGSAGCNPRQSDRTVETARSGRVCGC